MIRELTNYVDSSPILLEPAQIAVPTEDRYVEKVPANVQLAAKGKLLERFRTLWWIPAADGERMWNTKRGSGQYSLLPPDSIVPSPQIVVNRAHHKVVSSFRLGVPENL